MKSEGDHVLALVARHVMPRNPAGIQEMPNELTYTLLKTAIDLHDRQVSAAERWKNFVPLWAALIGGVFGTLSVFITLWIKGCPK